MLGMRDHCLGLQLLYHPGLLSYLGAQLLHLHGLSFINVGRSRWSSGDIPLP